MNKLLQEVNKMDMAIEPQQIAAGAIAISRFFQLGRDRKALAHVLMQFLAGQQVGDTIDVGLVDDSAVAPAATGALAALVAAADPGVHDYRQVVCGTASTVVTISDATAAPGHTITINGVVFPFAAVPALPGEWVNAAGLAVQINALLPALTAAAVGAVVTVIATNPGEQTITLAAIAGFLAAEVLILQAQTLMEVDMSEFVPGSTTFAVVVDNLAGNTDNTEVAVSLTRANSYYAPVVQAIA